MNIVARMIIAKGVDYLEREEAAENLRKETIAAWEEY
jgi:hypothetical protein